MARQHLQQLQAQARFREYAGFNLLCGDTRSADVAVLGNRGGAAAAGPQAVPPGAHALSNSVFGDEWPKVSAGRARFAARNAPAPAKRPARPAPGCQLVVLLGLVTFAQAFGAAAAGGAAGADEVRRVVIAVAFALRSPVDEASVLAARTLPVYSSSRALENAR
jgi:hypothetical protein